MAQNSSQNYAEYLSDFFNHKLDFGTPKPYGSKYDMPLSTYLSNISLEERDYNARHRSNPYMRNTPPEITYKYNSSVSQSAKFPFNFSIKTTTGETNHFIVTKDRGIFLIDLENLSQFEANLYTSQNSEERISKECKEVDAESLVNDLRIKLFGLRKDSLSHPVERDLLPLKEKSYNPREHLLQSAEQSAATENPELPSSEVTKATDSKWSLKSLLPPYGRSA